jgi:hypothetical protein
VFSFVRNPIWLSIAIEKIAKKKQEEKPSSATDAIIATKGRREPVEGATTAGSACGRRYQ